MPDVRPSWTDERLDDMSNRIDQRFEQIDRRFEQVERRFEQLELRMDTRFGEVNARIDSLQRIMIQMGAVQTLAILGTLVTVVLTRG